MKTNVAPPADSALEPTHIARFIELVPVPVTVIDADGFSLLVNRAYCETLGLTAEVAMSRTLEESIHAADVAGARRTIAAALDHGLASDELRVRHADGRYLTFRWDIMHDRSVGAIIAIASDRTSERARLVEAQQRARTDPLTGLLSRAGLVEDLEALHGGAPEGGVTVAMIDIDGFKTINDSLGQRVGDQVLGAIGRRLRDALSARCSVGRWGGDEFVVLCPSRTVDPHQIVATLRTALSAPIEVDGRRIVIDTSIGLCRSSGGESMDHLLRNADIAVQESKRLGGDRASIATRDLVERWERIRSTERALGEAIGRGEFLPYYQPIVQVGGRGIVGHEVLLRWVKPDGTVEPAVDFIDVADASGLLPAMSAEVRSGAVELAAMSPEVNIALNVSADELLGERFGCELTAMVRAHGVDPRRIILEVTEQTALRDIGRAAAVLGALRAAGFAIALDDFGSGYSSLTYLTRLPIDIVKLDRHFVRAAAESERGHAILTAVTDFVRQIELTVVAEGIETADDHELIRGLGIDRGQGWYYGRPVPAHSLAG